MHSQAQEIKSEKTKISKRKIVLITGSSLGIGAETALKFAKEGHIPIITYYKDKKEAEKIAKQCKLLTNSEILILELNIMNEKSILSCIKSVIKKYNQIDILINNAGIVIDKLFEEYEPEDIDDEINTNLLGLVKMTYFCIPYLKLSRNAHIINLGSVLAKDTMSGVSGYCATKFGIRGFTQALSHELPDNITTYCINPNATATRMVDFKGIHPSKVAEIIYNSTENKYRLPSGSDIDIDDFI